MKRAEVRLLFANIGLLWTYFSILGGQAKLVPLKYSIPIGIGLLLTEVIVETAVG